MNNNDTGTNGVNNGFNNMNGMQQNPSTGQPTAPQPTNLNGESLQGMSLGSVAPSNNINNPMSSGVQPMNMGMGSEGMTSITGMNSDNNISNMNISNPSVEGNIDTLGTITNENLQPQSEPIPSNINPVENNNIDSIGTIDNANGLNAPFGQSVAEPVMSNNLNMNPSFDNSSMSMNTNPMNNMSTGGDMNSSMNPGMGMNDSLNPGMNMMGNNSFNPDMNMGINQNGMNPNFGNPMNPGMPNNNIMENIPTPPNMVDFNQNGGKKSKKGLSKTTILLILVLIIALIGVGVYFLLNMTKKPKGNIQVNDLQWDLGKELSTNVTDYATITGFDSTVCSLDVSKVDINKMGAYDYTVTCGTTSKSGKIILQDSTAPVVVTKKVSVVPGSNVKIEDFIVSCTDSSNCTYELEDKNQTLDALTAQEGTHRLNLIVSDDYNNQTTVEIVLEVTSNAPVKFMFCTPSSTIDDELNANVETTYNYGINNDNVLVQTQKVITYTFETREDYESSKERLKENNEDAVITTDDEEFVITITSDLLENDLSTEFNVNSFPNNYDDLKEFNLNQGISCKNR